MEKPTVLVLSDEILDKVREVVERRRQICTMLEKAENQRNEVHENVFQRVNADYQRRLATIDVEYQPLREQMNTELQRIQQAQQKVQADLSVHSENLEEVRFRHQVGEFSAQELKQKEQEVEAELRHLEGQVATATATLETATELLGDDAQLQPSPATEIAPEPPSEAAENALELQTPASPEVVAPDPPPGADEPWLDELVSELPPAAAEPEAERTQIEPRESQQPTAEQAPEPAEASDQPARGKRRFGGLFGISAHSRSSLAGAFAAPPAGAPNADSDDSPPGEALAGLSNDNATVLMDSEVNGSGTSSAGAGEQVALCGILQHKEPNDDAQWRFGAEGLVLGRNPRCDVVIAEPAVSRRHAVIELDERIFYIEDTSSGGGIKINGQTVSRQQLSSGDEIAIGEQLFEFFIE